MTNWTLRKLVSLVWLSLALLLLFLTIRLMMAYASWSNEQEEVLGKLISYKKQLDFLRKPTESEERAGEISPGAVAIPSKIYDRNGVVIGEFFTERRSLIPIENLPKHLLQALIASEDRKFYEHEGVNFTAIIRAFVTNILQLRFAQGGSTITQQLAKVLFTSQEKTIDRKMYEYFCAKEIESRFTKNEILEMYLNLIYMGHGNYGVESAAQLYFNKSAADLTLGESAMLVALLPNPKLFSPISNLERSLERTEVVLNAMVETGVLKTDAAVKEMANFKKTWQIVSLQGNLVSRIGDFPDKAYRVNLAPFFLDHIRQKLLTLFSNDVLTRGGLKIYTTLDYRRQAAATNALKSSIEMQLKYYDKQIAAAKKKNNAKAVESLEDLKNQLNGAFITLEPQSGYILTMIGGKEFSNKNMFNRALKAKRQIGSLMKPFIYYLAISQKLLTPASLVEDTPVKIGDISFRNYDGKFSGKMTLRQALKQSKNTTAVLTLQQLGFDDLRRMIADTLDISYAEASTRIPKELGVALGTSLFTPLETAQIYAALVNHGKRVVPRDLLRVEDSQGKILWEEQETPPEISVLDPVASYITISMMQGVFEEDGTAGWVASLRRKDPTYLPFDIAGKTGTTSDYVDAWFAGMTSDEVSIIWIGNDNNVSLGYGRAGGSLCAPAWVNYIRAGRLNSPPRDFAENWPLENIVRESFCASSGGVPRAEGVCPDVVRDQVFFEGTEPRTFDPRLPTEPETLLPVP